MIFISILIKHGTSPFSQYVFLILECNAEEALFNLLIYKFHTVKCTVNLQKFCLAFSVKQNEWKNEYNAKSEIMFAHAVKFCYSATVYHNVAMYLWIWIYTFTYLYKTLEFYYHTGNGICLWRQTIQHSRFCEEAVAIGFIPHLHTSVFSDMEICFT